MAPKPNGFMIFTFEWKGKYGKNLSMREATTEAGKIWANMNASERQPYNDRAKTAKVQGKSRGEKFTCTGTPLSVVEQEKQDAENRERQMKRYIETIVRNSLKNGELDTQSYFFIMVNYFTKTLRGGVYVPAEISIAEYSLKEGVKRKYHSFVNPGVNIYGHQYEAQHHAETTHKLPLPPKAMGETNLGSVYNHVLAFIRDPETGEYPPLYTNRDGMAIVESVLEFLKADVGAKNIGMTIYSIQYLFYILKEATCEMGEIEKPKSFYITDAYFERDFFEYQSGIACEYHEEIDKSKYCTSSCVTRWGFMFSDYMCRDIAISLKPGRHVPQSTNLNAIKEPKAASAINENASCVSFGTDATYATKALSEHKIYYDDQKPTSSNIGASKRSSDDDFETVSYKSHSLKKNPAAIAAAAAITAPAAPAATAAAYSTKKSYNFPKATALDSSDDDDAALNPWSLRSRKVPAKPDTSHFTIEYSRDECSDSDELSSISSVGRGRGLLNRSLNSHSNAPGAGRGRLFMP